MSSMALRLSAWLLCLCLASTTSRAAEMEHGGLQLTGDTFKSTVSQGTYFVEFFSPYCGHCRRFAPEWQRLTQTDFQDSHDRFAFAQVDCVASGDLCAAEQIKGYPTMWLYRDGVQSEEYASVRTVPDISAWLDKRVDRRDIVVDPVVPPVELPHERQAAELEVQRKQNVLPQGAAAPADGRQAQQQQQQQQPETYNLEVPVQAQQKRPSALANGVVQPLSTELFDTLATGREGPLFVKFYAPWCGHCKALAPTWRDLAVALKGSVIVAEVNCEDSDTRDICKAQGITGYPTLAFFSEGEKLDYSGGRSLTQMEAWVRKVSAAHGIRDISPLEFDTLLHSEDTFFLQLYSPTTPPSQVTMLQDLTRALLGTASVYRSVSTELFQRFSLPLTESHLLTFKAHWPKPYAQHAITAADHKNGLLKYMKALRAPTFDQLSDDNAAIYMENPANPLVVILATRKDAQGLDRVANMRQIAETWVKEGRRKEREVLFTWIDADVWGGFISQMYGFDFKKQSYGIVIAEPASRVYYDVDASGASLRINLKQIFEALQDAERKDLQPKSSLNMAQRFSETVEKHMSTFVFAIGNHPILTAFCLLIFVAAMLIFLWMHENSGTINQPPWMSISTATGKGPYIPLARTGPKAD